MENEVFEVVMQHDKIGLCKLNAHYARTELTANTFIIIVLSQPIAECLKLLFKLIFFQLVAKATFIIFS